MGRIVHFEIHADEPERAIGFYEKVFGWKISGWGGPMEYWLIETGKGPGIDGAIKKREESIKAYVCTVDVYSIDEALEKIASNGGEVLMPKAAIPGIGWHSYCKDPEGNLFGVMEADKDARS